MDGKTSELIVGFSYFASAPKTTLRKIHVFGTNSKEVGTAVAQWLRRCATSWTVAGSIPDIYERIK